MLEIIPAIMPQNVEDLEDYVSRVVQHVSLVQIDVMDGKFVKSKTWPYIRDRGSFDNLKKEAEGLPFWDRVDYEIDLMVSHPETVIEDWIAIGASRIIIHIESTPDLESVVKLFRGRGVDLILSLNLDSSLDTILPYLEDIQGVQFMGIAHIGYQKQPFDERVINMIANFHNAHPEVIISVDGGVNEETAFILAQSGASRLVSGSYIFESTNVANAINILKTSFRN